MLLKDPGLLKHSNMINGQWVGSVSGRVFEVTNPATGAVIASVADGAAEDARNAVAAASDAWEAWRLKTAKERSMLLYKWYQLICEHEDDLARLLTIEQGKPLAESLGEIRYGASYIQWFAEEAKRINGDIIAPPGNDKRLLVIKQPVGVVAAITPWNFPMAMLARKVAPALAAGCTLVSKPAAETPLSAFALAELALRAGIPPGVFNVVAGSDAADIGGEFTSNPQVRKLTFTGSTAVGKLLMAQCAESVKKVTMELGGNAPFIVFDDADLEAAVQGFLVSKFRNAGQTCVCANRLLVQSAVYDDFLALLVTAIEGFSLGNGLDEGVNMGPLINAKAVSKVQNLIEDAVDKGAQVLGGDQKAEAGFIPPQVLVGATRTMRVFREEIFGPVAPAFRFEDEAEAVAMANDTPFGLAAYFYTQDISRVWRVGEALEYGMVGINEGAISNEMIPFGGVKESGLGREGSKYGIDDYLEIKHLCLGGLSQRE